MKETKTIRDYRSYSNGTIDYDEIWFQELFGWHYVRSSCTEIKSSGTMVKTYLVLNGDGKASIEKDYEDLGSDYETRHIFERDTDDPKYAQYCELERRVHLDVSDDYDLRKVMKSVFSRGVPKTYAQFKKRHKKNYVLGALLLFLWGFITMIGAEPEGYYEELNLELAQVWPTFLFLGFAVPGAVFVVRGIIRTIKSLNKARVAEEYRAYLGSWFSRKPNSGFCTVVREALELHIE